MRSMLATVLATVTLAACGSGLTPQQRNVQEQVLRDLVADWARHMNNQSLDSLPTFHDTTAAVTVAWPDGQRSLGWDEHRTALRDLFRDAARLNLVVQDPAVRVLERGVAVVTFRYSMDLITETSARDVYSGHGTQVWVREGTGRDWRILVTQMSRTPTGPTARSLLP